MVASLAIFTLLASACASDDEGGTGGDGAAACSAGKLKGFAAGLPGAPGKSYGAAANVHSLAQGKPTVKIGFFGDLTGANSGLVVHIRDAAKLAIEQANASGALQVDVKFVPKDNKDAAADTAPAIEQSFIDDDEVVAVLGGAFSGETLAVGSLFAAAKLTHVSASATNPDITTKGWPFFRALSTDEVQGAKVAEVLKGMGCAKIAVIDDKTDYGKGIAEFVNTNVKTQGLEVVAREGVEQKTADYGPLIDTIKASGADAVFYGGYYADGGNFLKQMREKSVNALWVCGDGCKDPELIKGAGATNAEGVVLTCPCSDPNVSADPDSQKFAADYKTAYGKEVGIYGAEGYDSARIILDAIAASDDDGKVTRQEIFDHIDKLEGFNGITKDFTFDEKGEVAGGAIIVYGVKGGAIKELGNAADVI